MVTPNAQEHLFQFTSHPAERSRSELIEPALAGAGCCCSCCCLHTVGGFAGALFYSLQDSATTKLPKQKQVDFEESLTDNEASPQSNTLTNRTIKIEQSVASLYWRTLFVLTTGILLIGLSIAHDKDNTKPLRDLLMDNGFGVFLILPGIQILAVLVSFGIVAMGGRGHRGASTEKFRQLARLGIGTTVGAFGGLLLMIVGCVGSNAVR